jgi:hypothetical protein
LLSEILTLIIYVLDDVCLRKHSVEKRSLPGGKVFAFLRAG